MSGEPKGDEDRASPKDDRARTETVLEQGMPESEQRKPRTGSDAEDLDDETPDEETKRRESGH